MKDQFAIRLDRFRQFLIEQKIDVGVIMSPKNVYYFTGFYSDPHERFMALVVDNKNDRTYLFVPKLDMDIAEGSSLVRSIIPISDTDDPFEVLQMNLVRNVKSIGVEKKIMSFYHFERLLHLFSGASFNDIEEYILNMRAKKTTDEMNKVQHAVDIVEKVLEKGIEMFNPGMTELDLTAELDYQMRKMGADKPAFPTIVLSGRRTALPHGMPSNNKIERNEFLLIDMGVYVNGYNSDISRTFIVGEGTEEHKKIYKVVHEAHQRAIDAIQIGERFGEVDRAARDHIKACGYGSYFNNRVGHGMGLEFHEAPSIHEQNNTIIEPGYIFTVEPGIYKPDIGGARIEDNVFINEDGSVQLLTSFPRELRMIN